MRYEYFEIRNYRAIRGPLVVDLRTRSLLPLIGLNECGKTTILQALFAFDTTNDEEYEGGHIKETLNLYDTKSAVATVTAAIRSAKVDWKKFLEDFCAAHLKALKVKMGALAASSPEVENLDSYKELKIQSDNYKSWQVMFARHIDNSDGLIKIVRNLTTLEYSIQGFDDSNVNFTNDFCEDILLAMPYILYNDDFQDRPPSSIKISTGKDKNPWQPIYEKLFQETNSDCSLVTTANIGDKRRRESIVPDVQALLNNTLSKAWKSFHLDQNKKVKIRLSLIPATKDAAAELNISIVENIGENERFFEVVDRSKGFLWFFNFVMKTEFNPKNLSDRSETIYLLDEPGSYLHSAAQMKLCEKLRAISNKNGKIIYCTHSPHLLDPKSIPINDIHIVSKSAKKEITAQKISTYKTKNERLTALQPVFEALQIDGQQFVGDRPVIAVEGIYDKYAISLFLPNSASYDILPGTSANSIGKNIQFLNAFCRTYIAVWDNDDEGRKELARAVKDYGAEEAKKFMLLPQINEKKCRMEQMFSAADMVMMKSRFNLEDHASYETAMVTAFYSNKATKQQLIKNISPETTERFGRLEKAITRILGFQSIQS